MSGSGWPFASVLCLRGTRIVSSLFGAVNHSQRITEFTFVNITLPALINQHYYVLSRKLLRKNKGRYRIRRYTSTHREKTNK